MTPLRYAELFAGAGGLSHGLEKAGLVPVFHAELADFPRRVLQDHWPDTPLLSDVRALAGGRKTAAWMRAHYGHARIDLLSGGSPCQDLSIAGKRAGLGGDRSSLFFRQARLWRVLECPYFLWENVAGALSSNHGADFATVLSTLVGAAVAVPSDGWRGGGVVAGPRAVAAWRLLDAQHMGVPQRRLRVFVLAARAGGCDPAEVLLEPDGVRGDSPSRRDAREGAAPDAGNRVAEPRGLGTVAHHGTANADSGHHRGHRGDDDCGPIGALAFDWQNSPSMGMECRSESSDSLRTNATPAVLAFDINQIANDTHRTKYSVDRESPALSVHNRIGAVCLTGEVTHALTHEGHDASEDGTGRGTPVVFTRQSHAEYAALFVASTLSARDYKSATDLVTEEVVGTLESRPTGGGFPGTDGATAGHIQATAGIPRRLVPIECERLMGWPDNWTNVPDAKGKPASDAARYKACGNGVVSHCAEWIATRLQLIHDATMADALSARGLSGEQAA